MENKLIDMKKDIEYLQVSTFRDLESRLKDILRRCGMFYKLFSRVKSGESSYIKIKSRIDEGRNDYKMQDLLGYRIVLYFKEDIELCEQFIKQEFDVVDISKDQEEVNEFKPTRINYVCKIPDNEKNSIVEIFDAYPIDSTFEIQLRTMFSEGWHEIEHDFRYKCSGDWEDNKDLARTLNGVLATLENCDWVITSLFDDLSYRHYRNNEWEAMIKNKLKIRIFEEEIDREILKIFNVNPSIAKSFFKCNRKELLSMLKLLNIPLNINNLIYVMNETQVHNEFIAKLVPDPLKTKIYNEGNDSANAVLE